MDQATFIKRKNGLFKKAMELSILCGCEIALIVFNSSKLFHYSSSDLDSTLVKYADFNDEANQGITNKDVCITVLQYSLYTSTNCYSAPAKRPLAKSFLRNVLMTNLRVRRRDTCCITLCLSVRGAGLLLLLYLSCMKHPKRFMVVQLNQLLPLFCHTKQIKVLITAQILPNCFHRFPRPTCSRGPSLLS